MASTQKGFHLVASLLIGTVIGLIGLTGWRVWQSHQTAASSQKPAQKSSNPYAGWNEYTNAGNEFRLLYPANWNIVSQSSGSSIKSRPDVTALQYVSIGSSSKGALGITEFLTPTSSANGATISHLRSGTEIISQENVWIRDLLANHEVDKDTLGQYEEYDFWHNKLLLSISMPLTYVPNIPGVPAEDNRQLTPQLKLIAQSVCFADEYGSGKCPSNK